MHIQHILVVCVGNICRSPMAEYLLKQQYPQLNIYSAGIAALVGQSADPKAQYALQALDLNIQAHVAQKINHQLIQAADLILVMSTKQQQYLEQTWTFSKGKVFRLGHWQHCDIADPYQHDQATFEQTCHLIQSCIRDWTSYL